MSRFDYRGRVAIVTGASSGIGRAVAVDLAERGTNVVCVARRAELLEETAAACRTHAPESRAVVADVTDRSAIEGVVARTIERQGRVDVLVNNAGIPMRIHASRLTPEDVERVTAVNFLGAVYPTLAVLPSMLERKEGWIINVASVAGRAAAPREAAYSASKHALVGWSDGIAADLEATGVRVHIVVPGPIETEIWGLAQEPPAYRGPFYPPSVIATAVRKCLDRGSYEVWAPKRMRPVGVFRALFPRSYTRGVARYDRRAARRARKEPPPRRT